jgi:hypothetical protein
MERERRKRKEKLNNGSLTMEKLKCRNNNEE